MPLRQQAKDFEIFFFYHRHPPFFFFFLIPGFYLTASALPNLLEFETPLHHHRAERATKEDKINSLVDSVKSWYLYKHLIIYLIKRKEKQKWKKNYNKYIIYWRNYWTLFSTFWMQFYICNREESANSGSSSTIKIKTKANLLRERTGRCNTKLRLRQQWKQ